MKKGAGNYICLNRISLAACPALKECGCQKKRTDLTPRRKKRRFYGGIDERQ